MKVINQLTLNREVILDYLGGSNVITRVLLRECRRFKPEEKVT